MEKSRIFVISDTHFNHKTMILEGWRKFNSVSEMNNQIISNWNKLVSKKDVVIHLGDVVMNGRKTYLNEISKKLNGKIVYINGNHDRTFGDFKINNLIIKYKGNLIEFVHDPANATNSTKIVIHGHIHLSNREFIRQEGIKYYNANLEFNKYKPKLLDEILGELKSAS